MQSISRVSVIFLFFYWGMHLAPVFAETVTNSALIGNVVDTQAEPVLSSVTAFQISVVNGYITPVRRCVAATDSSGYFECPRLMAGKYILVINPVNAALPTEKGLHNPKPRGDKPRFILYPPVYAGNMSYFLNLKPGQKEQVSVTVNSNPLSTIRVSMPEPEKGRAMQVYWQGDNFKIPVFDIGLQINSSDDFFEINNLPPGTYMFTKSWNQNGNEKEAIASAVVNEGSLNPVTLSQLRSYDVVGFAGIRDKFSLPRNIFTQPSQMRVVLNSRTQEFVHRYVADVHADLSFCFKNVVDGKYDISLDNEDGVFISDTMVGDRREYSSVIDIGDDSVNLPLRLIVGNAISSIKGSLKLEGTEPKPGILVHSLDSHVNILRPVDGQGVFSVSSLAPGEYLLYGWDDIRNVPYENARFLESFNRNAVSLNMGVNSHLTGVDVECNKANF